jgi:predicted outer membrane repeat protein
MLVNLSRVTLESCTVSDNHPDSGMGGGILVVVSSRLSLINTLVTNNSALTGGGIAATSGAQVTLDVASRVTGNTSTGSANSGGGIFLQGGGGTSAFLPSVDNVTDNDPDDCRGTGSYTGAGAVCTTT